jgi:hypothetical protein
MQMFKAEHMAAGTESCFTKFHGRLEWLVKERAMALCLEKHVNIQAKTLDDIDDPELVTAIRMSFPLAMKVNTIIFNAFKFNSIDKNVWYLLLLALLLRDEPIFEEEAMLIQKLEDLCRVEINLDLFVSVTTQFAQDRKFVLDECDHYVRKFLPPTPPAEGEKSKTPARNRPFLSQLHAYFRISGLRAVNAAYEEVKQVYLRHRNYNRIEAQSLYTEMITLLRTTFLRFADERKRAEDYVDPTFGFKKL